MNAPLLDQLRDIHPPPSPGPWPPPPVWWIVAAVLAVAASWTLRRHARRRPLRVALIELERLASRHAAAPDPVQLARGVSRLLRRYAQARFPHENAARLAGDEWLRFLDAHGTPGEFAHGPGAVLGTLPYRPSGAPGTDIDAHALVRVVRQWLRSNAP